MSPRYDVFLSHSTADKPAVEYLAHKLRDVGIEPFLDKWHLIPGEPWEEALEEALDESQACAVFLGPNGIGGWQNEEMRSALESRVRNKAFRVIPVLLPNSFEPRKEELPRFLRRLTWVDFRVGLDDEEAFHRLVSGIRGTAPGPGGGGGGGGPIKPPRPHPYRSMAQAPEEFVPRREYKEVLEALCSAQGTVQPIGITTALRGAGGFGKTALAQQLCQDERVWETYPDGILWTTMGEEIDANGRLSRIPDSRPELGHRTLVCGVYAPSGTAVSVETSQPVHLDLGRPKTAGRLSKARSVRWPMRCWRPRRVGRRYP